MTNESTNETMHMVGLVVVRGSILTLFCEMRRSALLLLLSQIRAGGIGSARVRADLAEHRYLYLSCLCFCLSLISLTFVYSSLWTMTDIPVPSALAGDYLHINIQ
jgi:hypothetical protein